jgi:carboxypeptidase Q
MLRQTLLLMIALSVISAASAAEKAVEPLSVRYAEPARRIIAATMAGNDAHRKLEELCDDVGHRLSGSPGMERAVEWALATLRRDGHENVRAESVMVPRWVRGRESVEMLEPRQETLFMLGLGGSVGTPPEGITAEVVVVVDESGLDALGDKARGKIVLFNNPMPPYDPEKGSGYGQAVRFRTHGARLAAEKGAVACLIRSVTATSLRSPHTGAMNYGNASRKIPAAALSIEDAEMIARLTARGKRVVVRLKMEARDEGKVPSANVVGELRGRTRPEEIVVVSGHLDAWDVGHGAHDDAAGCVMSMEAISVLRRLDLIPQRTIRVVLWTNEENGLAGARQYVEDHADELRNHVAAIESDAGAFRPLGFSIDMRDEAARSLAAEQLGDILRLLAPLGATSVHVGWSGADIGAMKPAGVPLLGLHVEGSRYFDYHHSHADTFDKVDPQELSQCVAATAVTAYVLADMPTRLGEPMIQGTK